jgi:hypothetical protein
MSDDKIVTPNLDRVQRYRMYRGGTYEGDSLIEDANGPLVRLDDARDAIALALAAVEKAARKKAFAEVVAMLLPLKGHFTASVATAIEVLVRRAKGDETP